MGQAAERHDDRHSSRGRDFRPQPLRGGNTRLSPSRPESMRSAADEKATDDALQKAVNRETYLADPSQARRPIMRDMGHGTMSVKYHIPGLDEPVTIMQAKDEKGRPMDE
ncbi:MAG TPA: hypothetical protein VEW42_03780 [Candidatus Eisenbacteria bacterium]|nr:hypothetical protein [Candidatus Eisenbacteria bacterium]